MSRRTCPPRGVFRRAARTAAADHLRLSGAWGYHGDHAPHGDTFWQLRRRVPVVTVVVDTPARTREWFAVADDLTGEAGLVTSEIVPVARLTYERNLLAAARLESEANEPGGTT